MVVMFRQPRFSILALAVTVSLATVSMVGCSTKIGVREIDDATWFSRANRNALDSGSPSERTHQFLRREGLLDLFEDAPLELLRTLDARLVEKRERSVVERLNSSLL